MIKRLKFKFREVGKVTLDVEDDVSVEWEIK